MPDKTLFQIAEEIKKGAVTPGKQDDGAEIEQDIKIIGDIVLQETRIKTQNGEQGVLFQSWPRL